MIGLKRRLMNENTNLQNEINAIKNIILNTLTNEKHLISSNAISNNNITLYMEEGRLLDSKSITELNTLELVKLWIYKTVCLLNKVFLSFLQKLKTN